jgi:hypothetical protein
VLCAFLGAELRLQPSIDFEGETGFWRFDHSAGHSESTSLATTCALGYGESGTTDKTVPVTI